MSNSNPYNFTLPQTSNLNSINRNSLPIWAWILIAIAIIIVVILIIVLIWYAFRGNTKAVKIAQAPIVDPLATYV